MPATRDCPTQMSALLRQGYLQQRHDSAPIIPDHSTKILAILNAMSSSDESKVKDYDALDIQTLRDIPKYLLAWYDHITKMIHKKPTIGYPVEEVKPNTTYQSA